MNKISRRDFLKVTGIAAGAAALAGCGAASSTAAASSAAASSAASSAAGGQVTLSIYAQYADDDTKVPYDYAVKELATAYPNVALNLIVQAQDDGATLKTLRLPASCPTSSRRAPRLSTPCARPSRSWC